MRQLSCLFVFLISGMVVFGQNTLQITSSDKYIFRQKCTIVYDDESTSIADIELLESSKTEEMDEKNQHERYTHNLYQNTVNEESSFNQVNLSLLTGVNNPISKDTTSSKRALRRLPKNSFEMGMRDAKKYYKPRFKGNILQAENPNNFRINTDAAYKNGYIMGAKEKIRSRRKWLLAFGLFGVGLMSQHQYAYETPKDSTLRKKRDGLRFDPTFELGMRDAKKYYRIRNHWVTQNEKNPNNHLLTEDPAYQSGYAWIVQKKHKNLKLLIIALSIPVVFFLLLIVLLSGASGGFWF